MNVWFYVALALYVIMLFYMIVSNMVWTYWVREERTKIDKIATVLSIIVMPITMIWIAISDLLGHRERKERLKEVK